MKKALSIFLVLLLVCSFVGTAFAANEGSIEIKKAAVKEVSEGVYEAASDFAAYQMLELDSYDKNAGRYNYVVLPGWEAFFAKTEVKAYYTINADGYVEWVPVPGEDLEERGAEVALLALAYVQGINDDDNPANDIPAYTDFVVDQGTVTTDPTTGIEIANVKVSNLPLGYYLVDSTAGAICGLTTTNPAASFNAKNVPPTVKKQVKEDDVAIGSEWGKENDASIGQLIEFDATITVHAGAENYVFHDTMDEGLDFEEVTYIYHQKGSEYHEMNPAYYEIVEDPTDGCTFEIKFVGEFYKNVSSGDKVIILYTAKLNENAVYLDTNNNELWLEYGEGSETTHDKTETKTYGFDIVKTTSDGKLLYFTDGRKNAKFAIYEQEEGGTALAFVNEGTTTEGWNIYRLATEDERATGEVEMELTGGVIRVYGLDEGHYFLDETQAPETYNQLAKRKEISVEFNNFVELENGKPVTNTGFQVVNKAGSILPETGGMGTTLFITFGAIVVLGAGLLLITKKRMSMIKD